jgi:hypothetical protein
MTAAEIDAMRRRVEFLRDACGYSPAAIRREFLADEVRASYEAAGIRLSAKRAQRETNRLLRLVPFPECDS